MTKDDLITMSKELERVVLDSPAVAAANIGALKEVVAFALLEESKAWYFQTVAFQAQESAKEICQKLNESEVENSFLKSELKNWKISAEAAWAERDAALYQLTNMKAIAEKALDPEYMDKLKRDDIVMGCVKRVKIAEDALTEARKTIDRMRDVVTEGEKLANKMTEWGKPSYWTHEFIEALARLKGKP